MNILVINAGSSSLKYQLICTTDESVLAKGICERIGMHESVMKHTGKDGEKQVIQQDMPDHVQAMKLLLSVLTDKDTGVIGSLEEIHAVGHRVVHGGEAFTSSTLINEQVMDAIRANVPLAPLHNPANISGIDACHDVMPTTPMVAVFDTAFHQTMEPHAFLYALPYEDYKEHRIRRYGFHGTSHEFVAKRAAAVLGKNIEDLKIITCHLGNGSSIAAIKGGKSVDTSMGFTPLEGIAMGTRSGDLDPAILEYLMNVKGMTIAQTVSYLNKQSGMLGLSGISSDFRDLQEASAQGDERAKVALELFSYRVKKYIGAYAAAMNGVDVLVFTAGIGENDHDVRRDVCTDMEFLGIQIDHDANNNFKRGVETNLTALGGKVQVWILPTNEELAIAKATQAIVE